MSDEHLDIDTFRRQAREWLDANLERRDPKTSGRRLRGVDHKTVEGIASQRALQRRLYEGGYAGISFPAE